MLIRLVDSLMNQNKLIKQKGMTLIELVILMIVLAVGLTGIISVIMTVTNSKFEPLLQWQAIQVGSNVIDTLLTKKYDSSSDCEKLGETKQEYLCEFQGIDKQKLQATFPEIAARMGNIPAFDISIDIRPFYEEKLTKDVLAINVTISEPRLGDIHLSALKAARIKSDEKANRVHAY